MLFIEKIINASRPADIMGLLAAVHRGGCTQHTRQKLIHIVGIIWT